MYVLRVSEYVFNIDIMLTFNIFGDSDGWTDHI